MIVSVLFNEFILYSFLGWIWETVYCTIKTKHWSNRGFLFGPICPIYGTGGIIAKVIFFYTPAFRSNETSVWLVFIICAAGSAVLEYLTSWLMEKIFHARWWDYSDLPLNLHGRIALPTTICFGLAGILIVRYLFPVVGNADGMIPLFIHEILSLFLMGLMGCDFALTKASLTPLVQKIEAMQQNFDERAEQIVAASDIAQRRERMCALEQQFKIRLKDQAKALTVRQRYILDNMQGFHAGKGHIISIGERLKTAAKDIVENSGE